MHKRLHFFSVGGRIFLIALLCLNLGLILAPQVLPKPWRKPLLYSTQVVDSQGNTLTLYRSADGYWRFPVAARQIDPDFIRALLVIEDQRFYRHPGFDLPALLRAAWQAIRSGRVVSGASTLSMQTIRLLQPQSRTPAHKIMEILQAWQMERELNKQQILQLYLSLAPYGGNLQGLVAAAYFYWGSQSVQRFSAAQIALLLALPQAPERRRPDRHPLRAKKARDRVLGRLYQQDLLTDEQFMLALKTPLPRTRRAVPRQLVPLSNVLRGRYPDTRNIQTFIEPAIQTRVVQLAQRYATRLRGGMDVAIIVLNQQAEVIAFVSGLDFARQQFDLSRAPRSPGSALKPFIYGLGFEQKFFHPLTLSVDEPFVLADGYAPKNFSPHYYGVVNLQFALLQSLNTIAVKALAKVGVTRLTQRLARVGITLKTAPHERAGLGLALGSGALSLRQLVALYHALSQCGRFTPLRLSKQDPIAPTRTLLSAAAATQVDGILQKMPQSVTIAGQRIRYKTGTSHAYQDFWSIGYQEDYTIGVWLGYPRPQSALRQSAQQLATPLMLQLFTVLLSGKDHSGYPQKDNSGHPQNKIIKNNNNQKSILLPCARNLDQSLQKIHSNADLPRYMRWLMLDFEFVPQQEGDSNPLRIVTPKDGSTIMAPFDAVTEQTELVLKAKGGSAPYFWLVNQRLLSAEPGQKQQQARVSAGPQTITLIDSKGVQRTIHIHISRQ